MHAVVRPRPTKGFPVKIIPSEGEGHTDIQRIVDSTSYGWNVLMRDDSDVKV